MYTRLIIFLVYQMTILLLAYLLISQLWVNAFCKVTSIFVSVSISINLNQTKNIIKYFRTNCLTINIIIATMFSSQTY